jgi:GAF domain-containing protein
MAPTDAEHTTEPSAPEGSPALPSDASRQSALVALGRRAVAASDTLLLMQDAAALLAESLDADLSSVAELTADGEGLCVWLSNSNGGPPLTFQTGIGERESLHGFALRIGHPVIIADLQNDPRASDARLLRQGVRSAIVCPLRLNEHPFGALGVYLTKPQQFSPADVLFVETISHLITTTVAREHAERRLAHERAFAATVMETV